MSKSTLVINTPETCGDCPFCIFTAEEKNYIGYCHTSDDDFYCKVLDRFMEYDKVDGGSRHTRKTYGLSVTGRK